MSGRVRILRTTPEQLEVITCALCGSERSRPYMLKFNLPIAKCTQCGLVFANPRLPLHEINKRYSSEYFWNEYLPTVGAAGGEVNLVELDARYRHWLDLLRRETSGRILLEVGIGAGLFLKAAERAGWEPTGLELSPDGVAFARQRLGLHVIESRAEDAPFPARTFDAAAMFDVIEHLSDPGSVVAAVQRALKPGGVFLVTTPNLHSLTRWVLGKDWASLSPAEHLYYFTERTLGQQLRAAGFTRVRFARELAGVNEFQTMNALYSHGPDSPRTRRYYAQVQRRGAKWAPRIRKLGLSDMLVAIAYA